MENYRKNNKLAWEEAFNNRSQAYDKSVYETLLHNPKTLFSESLNRLLEQIETKDKVLAQFCCNNGRETMATLAYGFKQSFGFDIADNMIAFANDTAKKSNLNAQFIATDILHINPHYKQCFDYGLFTVGALCWFKHLDELFQSVTETMKIGGELIIEDLHPFGNMLAEKGQEFYNNQHPQLPVFSYFKETPWIEESGMGYMVDKPYKSKVFTSYSHTISDIIMGLVRNGFSILYFEENDCDQSNMFTHLNHKELPLTYVLKAKKIR